MPIPCKIHLSINQNQKVHQTIEKKNTAVIRLNNLRMIHLFILLAKAYYKYIGCFVFFCMFCISISRIFSFANDFIII